MNEGSQQRRRLLLPEQRHLLETFAGQIALALERAEPGLGSSP